MSKTQVSVLLSVHGDSIFLKDFLDSLANQSFRDFVLLCRFDGVPSPAILSLVSGFPSAVVLPDQTHYNVISSYQRLLDAAKETDTPYFMFADQDDVWHPDKIARSVQKIRDAESRRPAKTPVLVHTDLRVVDEHLKQIAPSMIRYQCLNPARVSLADIMIQNNVTGCTTIFNRALASLARIPEEAICHDWYLALTAAAFGTIVFLPESTVDYRQHEDNVYGTVPRKGLLRHFFQRRHLHERVRLTQRQAGAFLDHFRANLSADKTRILEDWSRCLTEASYFKRLGTVWRHGFRKNDWLRTLGLWWAA
jgi:glycosyltransferase involved in cell wall biosynthesis